LLGHCAYSQCGEYVVSTVGDAITGLSGSVQWQLNTDL
jgi:hypothetical protein